MNYHCLPFKLRTALFLLCSCCVSFMTTAQTEDFVILTNTVENKIGLQASLPVNVEVSEISYVDELLNSLLDITKENQNIGNIHLFTNGNATSVELGSGIFDASSLTTYDGILDEFTIQANSQNQINLFIYGCHVATSDAGKEFLNLLSSKTGFNILAMTNCNTNDEGENQFDFSTSGNLISATNFSH